MHVIEGHQKASIVLHDAHKATPSPKKIEASTPAMRGNVIATPPEKKSLNSYGRSRFKALLLIGMGGFLCLCLAPPVMRTTRARLISRRVTESSDAKNAYVTLVAGCDPAKPSYMGMVFNVAVASTILRQFGSKSDVVVMVRMANTTRDTTLPGDVERLLSDSGVRVMYLPKVKEDSFYTAVMEKFRSLALVEYRRILFLDADVMPLCNLDYIFDMSDRKNPTLMENLVVAAMRSPAQADFFMLKPSYQDYLDILGIVQRREKANSVLDPLKGWGHEIVPPDKWDLKGFNESGTTWTYWGAVADQGLLYHWVKYVKKSVSIINEDITQNWGIKEGDSPDSEVQLLSTSKRLFRRGCKSPYKFVNHRTTDAPFTDFEHFISQKKPWIRGNVTEDLKKHTDARDPYELWYHILRKVLARSGMEVNLEELSYETPTLGFSGALKEKMPPVGQRMYKPKNGTKLGMRRNFTHAHGTPRNNSKFMNPGVGKNFTQTTLLSHESRIEKKGLLE